MICGPTGSGKTNLVCSLNPEVFEVISFDSRQVYQEISIGTAKPTIEERSKIKHHLVDFLSPKEKINASSFVGLANSVLKKIYSEKKIPVIVCGTGFYLKAFLYGMYPVPKISDAVRDSIEKMTTDEKLNYLKNLDPDSIARLSKNDDYRISRALEVNLSGSKWSLLKNESTNGILSKKEIEVTGFFLDEDRKILYDRINRRALEMLEKGMIEETRSILEKYGENCPALNTLGYNFTLEFIRGKSDIGRLQEDLKKSHRNYAKKQITWFRKESILQPTSRESALDYLKKI